MKRHGILFPIKVNNAKSYKFLINNSKGNAEIKSNLSLKI